MPCVAPVVQGKAVGRQHLDKSRFDDDDDDVDMYDVDVYVCLQYTHTG